MAFTTETVQTYRWRTAGLAHPADLTETLTAAETAYRQMYALDPTAPLDPAALDVTVDGTEVLLSFTVPTQQTAP